VSFVPPCPPAVVNAVRAALDVFQLYRAQIEKGSLIPLQPVLREYAVALGGLDRRLVEMGLDWLVGGGYVTRTWKPVGTERVLPGGRTEFVGPVSMEAVLTPTPALWQLAETWPCSQKHPEAAPPADEPEVEAAPQPQANSGESGNAAAVDQDVWQAAVSLYTGGVADDRLRQVVAIAGQKELTVGERLQKIDELLPIPPTATLSALGLLFGVSREAVRTTPWWQKSRAGERELKTDRRRQRLQQRAKLCPPDPDRD